MAAYGENGEKFAIGIRMTARRTGCESRAGDVVAINSIYPAPRKF